MNSEVFFNFNLPYDQQFLMFIVVVVFSFPFPPYSYNQQFAPVQAAPVGWEVK